MALQQDFDVVWCKGTVGEQIFKPWVDSITQRGCRFLSNTRVTDLLVDELSGSIKGVICGAVTVRADAVIFSVGISGLQRIVANRYHSCFSDLEALT